MLLMGAERYPEALRISTLPEAFLGRSVYENSMRAGIL
jgi:hypothetical protein